MAKLEIVMCSRTNKIKIITHIVINNKESISDEPVCKILSFLSFAWENIRCRLEGWVFKLFTKRSGRNWFWKVKEAIVNLRFVRLFVIILGSQATAKLIKVQIADRNSSEHSKRINSKLNYFNYRDKPRIAQNFYHPV